MIWDLCYCCGGGDVVEVYCAIDSVYVCMVLVWWGSLGFVVICRLSTDGFRSVVQAQERVVEFDVKRRW